jgi:hypothetical protein
MLPTNMPVRGVVFFAHGQDEREVVAGGLALMRERIVTHAGEAALREAAARKTARMLAQSGLAVMVEEDPGQGRTWR